MDFGHYNFKVKNEFTDVSNNLTISMPWPES